MGAMRPGVSFSKFSKIDIMIQYARVEEAESKKIFRLYDINVQRVMHTPDLLLDVAFCGFSRRCWGGIDS